MGGLSQFHGQCQGWFCELSDQPRQVPGFQPQCSFGPEDASMTGGSGANDLNDSHKIEAWLEANSEMSEAQVAKWLRPETIACPLDARTRSSVIQQMVELVVGTGLLRDGEQMKEAVRDREHLHPTALDNGVALLHPRRPLASILAEPVLAIGRTEQGIVFGGPRGELTDVFFLICSTDDTGHLQMLARLSRMLADPGFLDSVRTDMELCGVTLLDLSI